MPPGLVPLGSLKGEPGLFAAWPGVVSPKSWQDWLGGPGGPGGLSAQAGPARPNPNTSTVDATITLRRITIASISKGSDSEAPDPPPGGKVRPHMCGNDVPAAGGEPILASSQARPAPDNRAGHSYVTTGRLTIPSAFGNTVTTRLWVSLPAESEDLSSAFRAVLATISCLLARSGALDQRRICLSVLLDGEHLVQPGDFEQLPDR